MNWLNLVQSVGILGCGIVVGYGLAEGGRIIWWAVALGVIPLLLVIARQGLIRR